MGTGAGQQGPNGPQMPGIPGGGIASMMGGMPQGMGGQQSRPMGGPPPMGGMPPGIASLFAQGQGQQPMGSKPMMGRPVDPRMVSQSGYRS